MFRLIIEILIDRIGIQIVFALFGYEIIESASTYSIVERLGIRLNLFELGRLRVFYSGSPVCGTLRRTSNLDGLGIEIISRSNLRILISIKWAFNLLMCQ